MAGSGSATGSGSAAAMGSGSAAGSGSGAGSADGQAMAHHAGMCPSTVFGSTTKDDLSKDKKSLVLTITSDDKDAIMAIQKRTDELLAEKTGAPKPSSDMHDKKGAHGGGIGICPVHVPEGAKTKSKKVAKGVEITITPKDNLDAFKTDVDARVQKASDWVAKNIKPGDKGNQGGDGGGKGDHGMNHSGSGDAKGQERNKDGTGGGKGTGGGGGKGTGGGSGKG
jgi:hypothetical protein